jgi:hypothetical protein
MELVNYLVTFVSRKHKLNRISYLACLVIDGFKIYTTDYVQNKI